MADHLEAVLFDKDGTLVDFHLTWDREVGAALRAATASGDQLARAADVLGYDLALDAIRPDSPFVAESSEVVAALIDGVVDVAAFERHLAEASVAGIPAPGASDALAELAARRLRLGVVTNDWESMARDQLRGLGWHEELVAVVGSDSGYGAKPEPEIVLAALVQLGCEPSRAALVGDSVHDLDAARRAGVIAVLVTNRSQPPRATAARADLVVADLTSLVPELQRAGLLR